MYADFIPSNILYDDGENLLQQTETVSSPPASLTTLSPLKPTGGLKFPYPNVFIATVWVLLALAYLISRWRQRSKSIYIIPRVFVLCSPRTVQFHYELILRIGLPSYDFNPDKHDIDITLLGQTKNEVVPMTRLNTKTLLDESLITNLSIVAYRLVEMPPLGGLILRHSGPFKSWVYAYDFTVIDLSTNKEQYYTLNQYVGSLDRIMPLEDPNGGNNVQYPIDDVPLPQWTIEDIFLFLYLVINFIMLTVSLMPINCSYPHDIISVGLTAVFGGTLVFFLDWLVYYYLRWNQDRKEFFNDFETSCFCFSEFIWRIIIGLISTAIGIACIYQTITITDWRDSLVWLLVVINSCTLVIGIWNVARLAEFGESIVGCGLRLRGIDMVPVGMRYSDLVADIRTKSGSTSDDGVGSSMSTASKINRTLGTRASVKSLGFDLPKGRTNIMSRLPGSRISSTGATPNAMLSSHSHRANPTSAAKASAIAAVASNKVVGGSVLSSSALPSKSDSHRKEKEKEKSGGSQKVPPPGAGQAAQAHKS